MGSADCEVIVIISTEMTNYIGGVKTEATDDCILDKVLDITLFLKNQTVAFFLIPVSFTFNIPSSL